MFFLGTANAAGWPNCSYKGGDPGFVRVLDPVTLVFPNYDGNGITYLKAAAVLVIGTFLGFWFARTVLHFTGKGAALIGIGFALAPR